MTFAFAPSNILAGLFRQPEALCIKSGDKIRNKYASLSVDAESKMSNKQSVNDFLLSYREVIPDQTGAQTWKEISLNTGKYEPKLRLWLRLAEQFCVVFAFSVVQEQLKTLCRTSKWQREPADSTTARPMRLTAIDSYTGNSVCSRRVRANILSSSPLPGEPAGTSSSYPRSVWTST